MSEYNEENYCNCGKNCKCGEKYLKSYLESNSTHEEKFLQLADEAWMELLKEKVKSKIEKNQGENLDKLAEIITQANKAKWKQKLSAEYNSEEFKNSLKDFFGGK